jgi:hypothetical protein
MSLQAYHAPEKTVHVDMSRAGNEVRLWQAYHAHETLLAMDRSMVGKDVIS